MMIAYLDLLGLARVAAACCSLRVLWSRLVSLGGRLKVSSQKDLEASFATHTV